MKQNLIEAFDQIIRDKREKQQLRLQANRADEEVIQRLLEDKQRAMEDVGRPVINGYHNKATWTPELEAQIMDSFAKTLDEAEANLSKVLRALILSFDSGLDYTSSSILKMLKPEQCPKGLMSKLNENQGSFRATLRSVSQRLEAKMQVRRVDAGGGAGVETRWERIGSVSTKEQLVECELA